MKLFFFLFLSFVSTRETDEACCKNMSLAEFELTRTCKVLLITLYLINKEMKKEINQIESKITRFQLQIVLLCFNF